MIYAQNRIYGFHWIRQQVSQDHLVMECDLCKRRSSLISKEGVLSWKEINKHEKEFVVNHRTCKLVNDYTLLNNMDKRKIKAKAS